jgi:hypothetical protein
LNQRPREVLVEVVSGNMLVFSVVGDKRNEYKHMVVVVVGLMSLVVLVEIASCCCLSS